MLPLRRRSRRWISLVSPLLGFVIIFQLLRGPQWPLFAQDSSTVAREDDGDFLCPPMPGIDDVLVVLKTGVTEALEKVPVHLRTTFRCIPHYVVFSDFAETIGGVQVHDVLRGVDDEVKQTVPDFNLYNRLRLYGRTGLLPSDNTQEENGAFGMPNNPGWKLDKWKFLPMIDESLQRKPDAKWFVFMEADTHIEWPNLMAWLARLDPDQPLYLGTETQIADVLFAHGGSGFVISNSAMRLVSEYRRERVAELDEYTDAHWAGDCVLGKVLADAGVPLTFSWPLLQNSRLGEVEPLTNAFYRQPWCYPIVGFHHLTPLDVEQMWRFDQDWFVKRKHSLLLHSDIFRERIFPEIKTGSRTDWDNLSGDEQQEPTTIASVEDCETRCRLDPDCMQYSFTHSEEDGRPKCLTSNSPRLGIKKPGVQSGWMVQRINATVHAKGVCEKAVWD